MTGTLPGLDRGDGHRQPGDDDRQDRAPRHGVNTLRGQNNVQGSCDMGSFPRELPSYRHVNLPEMRAICRDAWGVDIDGSGFRALCCARI